MIAWTSVGQELFGVSRYGAITTEMSAGSDVPMWDALHVRAMLLQPLVLI